MLPLPRNRILPAPKTRIYLRDNFRLRTGEEVGFAKAMKEQLAQAASGGFTLIAACAERPCDLSKDTKEPPPQMKHIWELPHWSSLYDAMYQASETDWYELHEKTIIRDSQDLLVDLRLTYGTSPRPRGLGHVYLYEEIRISGARIPGSYLRALNRFADEVRLRNWTWLWSATQVTGEPQLLCLLWSAPSLPTFEDALRDLSQKEFYQRMMSNVDMLRRRYMFPTLIETLPQGPILLNPNPGDPVPQYATSVTIQNLPPIG